MMRFCNETSDDVFLCFMWSQPHCMEGSDWQYAGWWHIRPGSCEVVYQNDLSDVNANWYFHAAGWEGPFRFPTPDHKFWRCEGENIEPGEVSRGYQEIDTGDFDDFTMHLT
jgi:uncharacterized membrane protein